MDAIEKWNTFFVTIELLVCLLGMAFNGVVIFTICKNIHRRISAPTYLILSIAVTDFLSSAIPVLDIVHCKIFPKEMAVWFGWMSGSCFHDISIRCRIHHSFSYHFSGKVLDYHKISFQRFLFQQRESTFDYLGLLDFLTRLQCATISGMVELRAGRNKCNMLS